MDPQRLNSVRWSYPVPFGGALVRFSTVGMLAGFLAGLVAGGVVSRLAMRFSAMAAGGNLEITFGGTVAVILIGGVVGVFGGLIYAGPAPSWPTRVVGGDWCSVCSFFRCSAGGSYEMTRLSPG